MIQRLASWGGSCVAAWVLMAAPAVALPVGDAQVDGVITAVGQAVDTGNVSPAHASSRAGVRADLSMCLPGSLGQGLDGKLFAHLRAGRGGAPVLPPTWSSTTDSAAFDGAVLGEAWYQLEHASPAGRWQITAGKIDPFAFFDQNAVADDESTRFLNNAFVHNPLLDSGGDAALDAQGFTHGLRVAYLAGADDGNRWAVSAGAFGPRGRALTIAQLEAAAAGGVVRAYAWNSALAADAGGRQARHSGWGASAEQRVAADVMLFGRYGQQLVGRPAFRQALTLGAEAHGIGVAAGALGGERLLELYYRFELGRYLQLTPDLQWIRHPAGDAGAAPVRAWGLRARIGF